MQVDPALPWDGSVEGGVIQLREPLTLQQLLDGALDVMFKDGHGELNEGSFQIYPSDQKLYVGGSSLDYRITNVDTSSSSTQYSELILEKTLGADETLNSVSVRVPEISVLPSLPWTDATEEGSIAFKEQFTGEMITNWPWDSPLMITVGNELGENPADIEVFGFDLYINNDGGSPQYKVTNYDYRLPNKVYQRLDLQKVMNSWVWLRKVDIMKSRCSPRLPWRNINGRITLPDGFVTTAANLNDILKPTYRFLPDGQVTEETAYGSWVEQDGHLYLTVIWERTTLQYAVAVSSDLNGVYLDLTPTENYETRARLVNMSLLWSDGYYANVNGFVIKVVENEIFPCYASQSSRTKMWYKVTNNGSLQLETYSGDTIPPTEILKEIKDQMVDRSTWWGSREYCDLDEEGVLEARLTIDDIEMLV